MNSYTIATVSIIAAACLMAATIAVPTFTNRAFALGVPSGGVAQGAQNTIHSIQNGLINANVAANVQANCAVSVLSNTCTR